MPPPTLPLSTPQPPGGARSTSNIKAPLILLYPKNIINLKLRGKVFLGRWFQANAFSGKIFLVKKFRAKSFGQKSFWAGGFGKWDGLKELFASGGDSIKVMRRLLDVTMTKFPGWKSTLKNWSRETETSRKMRDALYWQSGNVELLCKHD